MDRRLDALVGGSARLVGYDLPVTAVSPGETFTPTLHWRAEGRLDRSYRVTVQLVPAGTDGEPAGAPVAQHDGLPDGGRRPTSGWAAGEVVADAHPIAVDGGVPAGDYLLIAALYDPEDPAAPRPQVRQAGALRDHVVLQPLKVAPAGPER
jgi:hypothetical protein